MEEKKTEEETMEEEKWVEIRIDGYPRYCEESRIPEVLANIEALKKMYLEKGVSKELLDKMRFLCKGKDKPISDLCRQFNAETRDGKDMRMYSDLLGQAIASIIEVKEESDMDAFLGGSQISFTSEMMKGLDDFELICFLVIHNS